jgi:aspartate 1-decarboxylase
VVDIDNGARLETYVIEGEPGSGAICLNGAAAHLIHPGDKVIIISYAEYDDAELRDSGGHTPTIVHVDTANRPIPEDMARELAGDRIYTEVSAN